MPASRTVRRVGVRAWSAVTGTSSSKLADLALDNAAALAAVAAVVLLLSRPATWAVVLGVLAGLAALAAAGLLLRRAARRRQALLRAHLGLRLVLLVAVAGAYLLRRPDEPGWVWLATGLGLLGILTEGSLALAATKTQQVAVHLPGIPTVPEPPLPFGTVAWASVALAAVGAVLAALAAPGWVYLVAAVLLLVPTALLAAHVARANVAATKAATGLRAAIERHAPAFVVYYAAVEGAKYQLGMWLPYLDRLGKPYVVITRNASTLPVISSLTDAPVVVPRTKGSVGGLDAVMVPSVKAAFYVQGSPLNGLLQRYNSVIHCWLNHGDSDKVANYAARHVTYDKVFVSGQLGVDRYAANGVRIPPKHFEVVGRPQVERIEVHDEPLPPDQPRTVLYAPTWRGGRPSTDYSSLPLGEEIVAALLKRGSTVIFRPHPLSYTEPEDAGRIRQIQHRLAADRAANGRQHVWGHRAETEWDVAACINASDALVTDVSSVATDYLASGKPLAMVAVRARGEKFRQQFPIARVCYLIDKSLSDLDAALDQLHGDDPLAPARRRYRSYCLGDQLGPDAATEFLRVAGEIVAGRRPD